MSNQPTLLQTQLQTLCEQSQEGLATYPDCWGLLVPLSNSQLGGVVPLIKRASSPGAPAAKEHTFKIGRGGTNDLVLPGSDISSAHCTLTWMSSGRADARFDNESTYVFVEDHSSNGTYVNRKPIRHGLKTRLRVGDELSFGQRANPAYRYMFRLPSAPPATSGGVLEHYDLGPILGKGAFGTVQRALDRTTGQWLACKTVSKDPFAHKPAQLQMVKREVAILQSLEHPNICKLVDHFEDESAIWLVLELIEGGDLGEAVAREGVFSEHEARRLTAEICHAMEYSHSKSIVHRDLKPENILLTETIPRHAKVADFGLAKAVGDDTFLKTFCGTPVYLAPEVVDSCRQGREYTRLVDSWSVGVIAWSMITNTMPFVDDGGKAITRFKRQAIDWSQLTRRGVSDECVDWIQRMMELDPSRRMTIREALDHPWLAAERSPKFEEAPSASSSAWTFVDGASTTTVVPSSLVAGSSNSTTSSWIHLSREFNVPRVPAPSLASGQARLQATASLSSMPERGKLDRRLGRRFAPIPAAPLRKCHSVV